MEKLVKITLLNKKMKLSLIAIIILLIVTCTKNRIIISGMSALEESKSVPSRIDKFETKGYMDTTLGFFTGIILTSERNYNNQKIKTDTLIFQPITLINELDSLIIKSNTDINGLFKNFVSPGN